MTDLTVVRLTPDVLFDQMIGLGRVARVIFSYGGNPGVGSLHRFRDAVEHGWPRPIELLEHSHAGLANAYVAGASNLPFGLLRGYAGTDLPEHSDDISLHRLPVHRREAHRGARHQPRRRRSSTPSRPTSRATSSSGGSPASRRRRCSRPSTRSSPSRRSSTSSTPRPRAVVLPSWVLDAVCHVPNGAWPSYAADFSVRDNGFYSEWDAISRDRDRFTQWMEENVLAADAPVGAPVVAR